MSAPTPEQVEAALAEGKRLCGCTCLICKVCYPEIVWRNWMGEETWNNPRYKFRKYPVPT